MCGQGLGFLKRNEICVVNDQMKDELKERSNEFCVFSGIQEYVEAVSFHHFIRHRTLISLEEINARLVFIRENKV